MSNCHMATHEAAFLFLLPGDGENFFQSRTLKNWGAQFWTLSTIKKIIELYNSEIWKGP